ncbi:MAG: hypothetical protein ABFC94_01145 [Syntrophomonas sp.]
MVDYIKMKDFLCRAIGKKESEEADYNIIIDLSRNRYGNAQIEEKQLVVQDIELLNIYNKTTSMQYDGMILYTNSYYEVAMDLDYPGMSHRDVFSLVNDSANGISYELNRPSAEYSLYLIGNLIELRQDPVMRRRIPPIISRLRRPLDYRFNSDEVKELSIEDVLSRMIGELSIKIRSTNPRTLTAFKDLCSAFAFEFMYQTDMALIEYKAIDDVFNINMSPRNRFDISALDKPPLRIYTNDVVDYYKLALSSNDPYIKYISFYHIMEYFYDEIFKKRLVDDLKNKITHPTFSYKNDDKIYDMALFIKNRLKMNAQDGQGNELESLKFVLSEFINIDDLKKRINDIDETALSYYQETKVPFCNATAISWNDPQNIVTQLAKRIYYTRNSLVHSKSGKNNERYRPYENEKELQREVPLVKAVAELIIINSSGTL